MIQRMRSSVAVVHDLVSAVTPADDLEAEHRQDVLRWLQSTDDVYRRDKPATPPRHLVSYVVPVDPTDGTVLLVDHINAGLWLPPGGHVEPREHPAETASREALEELGIVGAEFEERPAFVTVTETVGIDAGHTDVSLWFVIEGRRSQRFTPERRRVPRRPLVDADRPVGRRSGALRSASHAVLRQDLARLAPERPVESGWYRRPVRSACSVRLRSDCAS
jgi:8-oxo-dGTP diphosphatase